MARKPLNIPWKELMSGGDVPPPVVEVVAGGGTTAGGHQAAAGNLCSDGTLTVHQLAETIARHKRHIAMLDLPDNGAKLHAKLRALEEEQERRKRLACSSKGKDDEECKEIKQLHSRSSPDSLKNITANPTAPYSASKSFSFHFSKALEAKADGGNCGTYGEELNFMFKDHSNKMNELDEMKNSQRMSSRASPFQGPKSVASKDKQQCCNRRHRGIELSGGSSLRLGEKWASHFTKGRKSPKTHGSLELKSTEDVVLLDEDVQPIEQIQEGDEPGERFLSSKKETKIHYPSRDHPECVELRESDIKCLEPSSYLSSTIMNFYIQYLQTEISSSGRPRGEYHFCNTYFYSKLVEAMSQKVWVYYYLPLQLPPIVRAPYPSGEAASRLPCMARWTPKVDRRTMFQQLEQLRRGLSAISRGSITWQPYRDDGVEGQPWVEAGSGVFYRDIWVHCLNLAEFCFFRLILRTRVYCQPDVDPSFVMSRKSRSHRYVGKRAINWREENRAEIADWNEGGTLVIPTIDSSKVYLQNYRRDYQDRLRLGLGPEASRSKWEIELQTQLDAAKLEVQRLRGVIQGLEADLARARSRDVGASSSSVQPSAWHRQEVASLQRQLEAAIARAGEAERDVMEQADGIHNTLRAERDTLRAERDALKVERDALLTEGALARERDQGRIMELERRLQSLPTPYASESQGALSWMPRQQLEIAYEASQKEVQRLLVEQLELTRQVGIWQGRAEEARAERRQRSHSGYSHGTSHFSRSQSKRGRRDEESRRGEGGDSEGGGES